MSYGLTRRALLRGLGGVACALPALELFGDEAQAQDDRPPRFVLLYGGMSTGRDNQPRSLIRPENLGAGYDLPRALLPLGGGALPWGGMGDDVQDDVSIVTGLKVPWGEGNDIPPGGRSVHFHYNTAEPQTTGVRRGPDRSNGEAATTADNIVADAIGADRPHRNLSYRVQAARYIAGGNATGGGLDALSLRRRENGSLQSIDAVSSPRLAYESLFSGFVPDTGARDEAIARLAQRRHVLSAVRARTNRVMPRLGAADRIRLERHFEELSELERRLASIPEPGGGACMLPTSPGEDPPLADGHNLNEDGNLRFTAGRGWSEETVRGNAMIDMVRMAFACDLTRSAAIRISLDQTFLNGESAVGAGSDMHQTTHGGGHADACSDSIGWHVSFFSRLVRQLRDTPDGSGSLLDHTAVVLLFEGGFGYDPEGVKNNAAHSTEDMPALVAGRVGGLRGGVHISAIDSHPAQVVASCMQAVGLEDRLGEVSGRIPELFV
ncbi:MAG: DUF1552 domain-containing protein [Myxococcota bacterium]